MRHRISGKRLGRTTSHRRALRRNMAASLIQHGAIRTTEAKAKELRPFIEKIISIARKGTLHARRQVIRLLQDRRMFAYDESQKGYAPEDLTVVQKLFNEVAPRYLDRPGGYTRIIRLGDRRIGDGGVQVLLQLVEETTRSGGEAQETSSWRKRRAAKRHKAVSAVDTATTEATTEETSADETPTGETDATEPVEPADEQDEEKKDTE